MLTQWLNLLSLFGEDYRGQESLHSAGDDAHQRAAIGPAHGVSVMSTRTWTRVPPEKMLPDEYTLGDPDDTGMDRIEISIASPGETPHDSAIVIWGRNGEAEDRARLVLHSQALFDKLEALCARLPHGRGLNFCEYRDEIEAARRVVASAKGLE